MNKRILPRFAEGMAILTLVAALTLPGWYVMSAMQQATPGVGGEPKIIAIGAITIFLCVLSGLALFAVRKREPVGHMRASIGALIASAVVTGAFVYTNLAQHNRQELTAANIAVGNDPAASPNFLWALLVVGGPAVLLIGLGISAFRNRSRSKPLDRESPNRTTEYR